MKTFEFEATIILQAENIELAWKEFDKKKEDFLARTGICEIAPIKSNALSRHILKVLKK